MSANNYEPSREGKRILAAAWDHVQSVKYRVSTRWLFYRLLQDGFFSDKKDYKNKYIPLLSRARKNYYNGWQPNTLVDENRNGIEQPQGFKDIDEWVSVISSGGFACALDHFYQQQNYTMVIFEATAMVSQFQYYTEGVSLWAFSGMPSIDYKYRIAQHITDKAAQYHKPVMVLYFGDYDPAGMTIPETSIADIRLWTSVDFNFIRCGLNPGDEIKYNIPENIDHPGAYQWEALDDSSAKNLITNSVNQFVDTAAIDYCHQEGAGAAEVFNRYISGFQEYYENHRRHQ